MQIQIRDSMPSSTLNVVIHQDYLVLAHNVQRDADSVTLSREEWEWVHTNVPRLLRVMETAGAIDD